MCVFPASRKASRQPGHGTARMERPVGLHGVLNAT